MSVPIGEWQWNKSTQRLTLSLVPPSLERLLSGDWALDDLSNVLDGLVTATSAQWPRNTEWRRSARVGDR